MCTHRFYDYYKASVRVKNYISIANLFPLIVFQHIYGIRLVSLLIVNIRKFKYEYILLGNGRSYHLKYRVYNYYEFIGSRVSSQVELTSVDNLGIVPCTPR